MNKIHRWLPTKMAEKSILFIWFCNGSITIFHSFRLIRSNVLTFFYFKKWLFRRFSSFGRIEIDDRLAYLFISCSMTFDRIEVNQWKDDGYENERHWLFDVILQKSQNSWDYVFESVFEIETFAGLAVDLSEYIYKF